MFKHTLMAVAAMSVFALATPVLAEDNSTTSASDAGRTLPDICTKNAQTMGAMDSMSQPSSNTMGSMGDMDQAHHDMMKGMDQMNTNMMQGMSASDIDVAFVCGMIPHHQGAIDMARAELAHGDNQWAKDMAQKVIDAQEKEISEMLTWLKDQTK